MSVNRKRGGASKSCTCRGCGTQFITTKIEVFCSGLCRHSYTLTNPKPANRDGAITDDTSNTN